jgi:hypothetical protein
MWNCDLFSHNWCPLLFTSNVSPLERWYPPVLRRVDICVGNQYISISVIQSLVLYQGCTCCSGLLRKVLVHAAVSLPHLIWDLFHLSFILVKILIIAISLLTQYNFKSTKVILWNDLNILLNMLHSLEKYLWHAIISKEAD